MCFCTFVRIIFLTIFSRWQYCWQSLTVATRFCRWVPSGCWVPSCHLTNQIELPHYTRCLIKFNGTLQRFPVTLHNAWVFIWSIYQKIQCIYFSLKLRFARWEVTSYPGTHFIVKMYHIFNYLLQKTKISKVLHRLLLETAGSSKTKFWTRERTVLFRMRNSKAQMHSHYQHLCFYQIISKY